MQVGAPSHIAREVNMLLLETFTEDRVISQGCKIEWLSRSLDLIPVDFWLRIYLKSHVYRCSPINLVELKGTIQRIIGVIHSDMLHSVVTSVLAHFICTITFADAHV